MYMGGSWVTTEEKRPVINPANESTIAEVPEAGVEHATHALEAAQKLAARPATQRLVSSTTTPRSSVPRWAPCSPPKRRTST
jgi:acyl-CoA reductase-like NAD-dependent aldehyde dehydrogenase